MDNNVLNVFVSFVCNHWHVRPSYFQFWVLLNEVHLSNVGRITVIWDVEYWLCVIVGWFLVIEKLVLC